MEDQGKRLLLAVAAAFAVMTIWMFLFPPEQPEEKPAQDPAAETAPSEGGEPAAPGTAEDPATAGEPAAPAATPTAPAATPATRGAEQLIEFKFDSFDAVFTSWGGALRSWKLNGDRYDVDGRQIDLVPPGEGERALPFQVGFEGSTHDVPERSEWQGEKTGDREAQFTWRSDQLEVVKTFTLYPDDFLVSLKVVVRKLADGDAKQALKVYSFGYQDPRADTGGGLGQMSVEWKAACDLGGDVDTWSWKSVVQSRKQRSGDVKWAGFTHSYFFSAMAPEPQDGILSCGAFGIEEQRGVMGVDIVFPTVNLTRSGQAFDRSLTAYLGPKYLDKLESISGIVGYDTGFADAIDLGWFSIIARPLLWLLKWFQSFVINWGIAIILLTCVVKLATLYWTTKSMRSMKAMGKLKPEIEKIQKKYKDDRQKQQVEIMALYKAHKVNPLAGCLPMLLQMPIWFALYKMLMAAAELYNAPFIPGWINDLTSPDPYYALPILLMGMMYLQARLSPTQADSTQQKIFMYGLPVMFGVFSFFFPSGLTVYILTNTVLTTLHQLWMNRGDDAAPKVAPATAGESTAAASAAAGDDDDGADDAEEAPKPARAPSAAPTSGRSAASKRGKKKSGKRKRTR
jgi:YidC/Oxa1 family membrane protein insertase